jgi:hypothetical protein
MQSDLEDNVGYLTDPLHQAPDGTWEQGPDGTHRFRWGRRTFRLKEKGSGVWSAQREGPQYRCDLRHCTCECPWQTLRMVPGQRCHHLLALFALLPRIGLTLCPGCEEREHCKQCGGRGVLEMGSAEAREEEELTPEELQELFNPGAMATR